MKPPNETIVVVTGGNRGIGFEICRRSPVAARRWS
jgi:NAD(P)-dependent dehydrogenase (short-subunit alcohol dehydrogenase family)